MYVKTGKKRSQYTNIQQESPILAMMYRSLAIYIYINNVEAYRIQPLRGDW
jgi:hypothetical protein